MKTENNPRIYCGTYGKYNNGSLFGKWFDLTDYDSIEELYEAFKEYHKKEYDPEFMFQDYENIPSQLISESSLNPEIYELINYHDIELLTDYLEHRGLYDSIEQLIESAEEHSRGNFNSLLEYAEQNFDELYLHDVPESVQSYINYKQYKYNLECSGVWISENGNVFDNSY